MNFMDDILEHIAEKKAKAKIDAALEYKCTAFEQFGEVISQTPVRTDEGKWVVTDLDNGEEIVLVEEDYDFPTVYIANGLDYVVDLEESPKNRPAGIINPAISATRRNK